MTSLVSTVFAGLFYISTGNACVVRELPKPDSCQVYQISEAAFRLCKAKGTTT